MGTILRRGRGNISGGLVQTLELSQFFTQARRLLATDCGIETGVDANGRSNPIHNLGDAFSDAVLLLGLTVLAHIGEMGGANVALQNVGLQSDNLSAEIPNVRATRIRANAGTGGTEWMELAEIRLTNMPTQERGHTRSWRSIPLYAVPGTPRLIP
jgi:hypothetical protein